MTERALLTPFSSLYGLGVQLKNSMYSRGFLKRVELAVPVLSVGNITMGGTGKTPVVEAFIKVAAAKGERVAVISRNYKAHCRGPVKITERIDGPFYYGDEPYWLWQQHPQMDVYVGPSKSETAQKLVRPNQSEYSLVIVDDGFQHQRLRRNLDVVLIDAAAPLTEYQLFPAGRAREPLDSIFERAGEVLLTKCNRAPAENLNYWREQLENRVSYNELSYYLGRITNLKTGEELTPGVDSSSLLGFCGLAQPKSFSASLDDFFGAEVAIKAFPDHYKYSSADIEELLARQPRPKLITTEKDAIKILSLDVNQSQIWVAQLEISPTDSIGLLYEKAKRTVG